MLRDLRPIARALKRNLSLEAWESIDDPRSPRGRRHRLASMLKQLTLGLMTGQRTLRDVERLGRRLPMLRQVGISSCPSDTTFDRLLRSLAPDRLRAAVHQQVRAMQRNKQLDQSIDFPFGLVAIDGKALGTDEKRLHPESHRVTGDGEPPRYVLKGIRAVHVSSAVRPVLDQQIQPSGKGERTGLVGFLAGLLRTYGSLVQCFSFDAGFWSFDLVHLLSSWFVRAIIALKGNAGAAHRFALAALKAGATDPPSGWQAETLERAGKRIIRRQWARVVDDLGTCGAVTEVWRQRTRIEVKGKVESEEDRYFATNFWAGEVTPLQAMAAIRAHWAIENDSNWTMDVILTEDTSAWVRQARAREVLTWLRIFAYNVLRLLRSRTLRAPRGELPPWRDVLDRVADTLKDKDAWEPGYS